MHRVIESIKFDWVGDISFSFTECFEGEKSRVYEGKLEKKEE